MLLPKEYTEVHPFNLPSTTFSLPDSSLTDVENKADYVEASMSEEYEWLQKVSDTLDENGDSEQKSLS